MAKIEGSLDVKIVDGELRISIGVGMMSHAITNGPLPSFYGEFEIINEDGFARDVLSALLREEEDGSTMVHRMFDSAAEHAIEQGSSNIRFEEDDD